MGSSPGLLVGVDEVNLQPKGVEPDRLRQQSHSSAGMPERLHLMR
jgi:hypothetical protein